MRKMGYENCYDNIYGIKLQAQAGMNSIKLGEWNNRRNKNNPERGKCLLCGAEREDLVHFLIKYEKLK